MAKIKLTQLAIELKKPFAELMSIKDEKLERSEWTGTGKNTWLTPEGAEKMKLAVEVPLAVPAILQAFGLHDAANPNWVYCRIEGFDGKKPVAIPRRLHGRLVGKTFPIHAISDATGTTYRHATLTGYNHAS